MAKDLENTMVDNNIYLLTQINPETTNGLIIQLTRWVNELPITEKTNNPKIYLPCEVIPNNIPVLNIWINCCGGNSAQTESILNTLYIASARGTIIKTYNIGRASSSASMIAVSGTHGYRYMGENTYNLIHYGNSRYEVEHPEENNFNNVDFERHLNSMYDLYLRNTRLTQKEIKKFFKTEGAGQLTAEQCLDKGLCDWIITNKGQFVNNITTSINQKKR